MELRDYLRGLRRYWLAIVLMTVAGVLVAAGWASMQKPLYQATASAYIAAPQNAKSTGIAGSQNSSLAQGYVPSFMDFVGWTSTAKAALAELKLKADPESVVGSVSVVNPEGTGVLKITATAGSPEAAQRLANAWVVGLQHTIDHVNGVGDKPGSAAMNVFLGNPAQASGSPVFPDWKTALLVGGVIGLGFGVAFALSRTASDRRIRSGEEVGEKLQHPVVGTIPERPDADKKKRSRGTDSTFAFAESLRVLRTNLQFMDVDNPPRTIVVTSPVPGDGKSTVAVELAKTLAASGTPTVLLDGDLRRPTVAKKLGLPAGAGLSDVLAGRADATELLQRVPGVSNLLVLAAGTVPPNPSEILGSERMHGLLAYLSSEATVIIDAPPLLPVTDGAVLTHQADGALLVVSAGKTTYDLAAKALEAIENARGRALGIVINRAPVRGVDASPYAYAYYAYYSHDDQAPAAKSADPTPAGATPGPKPAPLDADAMRLAPTSPTPISEPIDADDPFAESLRRIQESDAAADDDGDLDIHDVLTPALGDEEMTPRTTRNRSRRS